MAWVTATDLLRENEKLRAELAKARGESEERSQASTCGHSTSAAIAAYLERRKQ